jgi:uncharacterized membrane protein (DUF2068 family)
MSEDQRATGITIIAIGKMLKSTALIVIGIAAFGAASHDGPQKLEHWADLLRIDPNNRYLEHALAVVWGQDTRKLDEIGLGTFFYAALFLIEGGGLWFRRHWAEWFTIGITTSFIPIEIWEIGKHLTAGKIVALVLNVAAVVYLIVHLRQRRRRARAR